MEGCVSSLKDRACPGSGRAGFPVPQRWDGRISDLGISWCLRMIPELFVLVCVWAFIRPDFFFILLFLEGDCLLDFQSTAQQSYKHHKHILTKKKRLRMKIFILVTGKSNYFWWVLPM